MKTSSNPCLSHTDFKPEPQGPGLFAGESGLLVTAQRSWRSSQQKLSWGLQRTALSQPVEPTDKQECVCKRAMWPATPAKRQRWLLLHFHLLTSCKMSPVVRANSELCREMKWRKHGSSLGKLTQYKPIYHSLPLVNLVSTFTPSTKLKLTSKKDNGKIMLPYNIMKLSLID